MPRATPLAGSRMLMMASAPRTVSGRNGRGTLPNRSIRSASLRSNWRDARSLQCIAPSSSDHSSPAVSASVGSPPSSRAPMSNSNRPRPFNASICSAPQGNDASSGSQESSSRDSSCPPRFRGSRSRATACNRGSGGGALPSSSSVSRSRHQARRIAASRGSELVDTTSANARSRFQSARNAGRTRAGNA